LGRPFLDVWAEVREVAAPEITRALAGETVSVTGARFILLRNGEPEEAWFDYGYSPVYDEAGRVAGVLLTATEITTKVRAEAALRESEARFGLMADAVPQIVWIT
jgi:PAS domain-containing protein